MKLQIHNDGKGKWMSYEMRLEDDPWFTDFSGYGSNQAEALVEFKANVAKRIAQLQSIDFDQVPVPVDWAGKPI